MKEINNLINKILLVGIAILDEHDQLIEQFQVYGPIIRVNAEGIVIRRNGTDTEFSIPPDFDHITEVEPGEYRLRSTGEIVEDPDYVSSWTVKGGSRERIEHYSLYGFGGYEKG